MPRALALSPHLDDAAFSCGGTLALLAREGWKVTVCTAFTRSVPEPTGFALACQLDKGLPAEADYMALRRGEDAAACKALGAVPVWLDLPEAPHRGYGDVQALFGAPLEGDPIEGELAEMLAPLLKAGPTLVLAPQALGGHVDHVVLVRALRAVLDDDEAVCWWTDFPYAMRPHSHPARPFATEMDRLSEIAVRGVVEARETACLAYGSQIGFQFGGAEGLREVLELAGPLERLRASRVPGCLVNR